MMLSKYVWASQAVFMTKCKNIKEKCLRWTTVNNRN